LGVKITPNVSRAGHRGGQDRHHSIGSHELGPRVHREPGSQQGALRLERYIQIHGHSGDERGKPPDGGGVKSRSRCIEEF